MQIDNIKFEDGKPVEVSLTMSVENAAQLAKSLGKISFNDATADYWNGVSDTYLLLTGDLFNRFWDDGINDYFRTK